MKLLKNPYALLVVGIIVILGFLTVYSSAVNKVPTLPAGDASASTGWTKGPDTAPVTLVEFGDFQCPACKAYNPVVNQVLAAYGDKIKYTFKFFPLPIHQNAIPAALAAEAAGMQGKFWEMDDMLFNTQDDWATLGDTKPTFDRYAQQLGLDVAKFDTDMTSDAAKKAVADTQAEGTQLGVNYTPYFILNGTRIDNPNTVEDFYAAINAKLPANEQVQPSTATSSASNPGGASTSTGATGSTGSPQVGPKTTTQTNTNPNGPDYTPPAAQ